MTKIKYLAVSALAAGLLFGVAAVLVRPAAGDDDHPPPAGPGTKGETESTAARDQPPA